MHQNVGTLDRTVRLFVGPVLLVVVAAGLLGAVPFRVGPLVVALVVGLALTVTGVLQTCPFYRLVGVDTHLVARRLG